MGERKFEANKVRTKQRVVAQAVLPLDLLFPCIKGATPKDLPPTTDVLCAMSCRLTLMAFQQSSVGDILATTATTCLASSVTDTLGTRKLIRAGRFRLRSISVPGVWGFRASSMMNPEVAFAIAAINPLLRRMGCSKITLGIASSASSALASLATMSHIISMVPSIIANAARSNLLALLGAPLLGKVEGPRGDQEEAGTSEVGETEAGEAAEATGIHEAPVPLQEAEEDPGMKVGLKLQEEGTRRSAVAL